MTRPLLPPACIAAALAVVVAREGAPRPDAPASAPVPSAQVVRFLSAPAAEVLAGATRVEAFHMSAARAQEGQQALGGYAVGSTGAEQGEPFARRLAAVLLDEKTYDFDRSKVGGFAPSVGLRLWRGERWVEVLVSFATNEVVVFSPAADGASRRSAQEDCDAARPALLELARESLPHVADVQVPAKAPPRGKRKQATEE